MALSLCIYEKKVGVIPGAVGERETGRVAKEHSAPEAAATFFKACLCQVALAKSVWCGLVWFHLTRFCLFLS